MERFGSQETLGAVIYPPQDKKNGKTGYVYSTEFQAMLDGLDDEDGAEESYSQGTEKKKRLSLEQVKALERIFEVDNKLEPERKVRVAEELGLQPRQVAIWFQNRRARWKTKRLEKDYGALKADYEALRLSYDKLEKEKEGLVAELEVLRAKLGEENTDSDRSGREDTQLPDPDNNASEQSKASLRGIWGDPEPTHPAYEVQNNGNPIEIDGYSAFRDGLSDSNCSGVFNEDRTLNSEPRYEGFSTYAPWVNCFSFSDSRAGPGYPAKGYYYPEFGKTEEQSLFGIGDSTSIFSVDQASTLHWQY